MTTFDFKQELQGVQHSHSEQGQNTHRVAIKFKVSDETLATI